KVELLGPTQLEIPPDQRQTFWRRGHLGEAFRCRAPDGRSSAVERLLAIGTTKPDVDLSFLKVPTSFEDAIRWIDRDMGSDEDEPRDVWTATLVIMKIVRPPAVPPRLDAPR